MKEFSGKSIQRYFYAVKRGALTGTYGGGQVRTDDLKLPKGTYAIGVSCVNDTSVGNKLATGDYALSVKDDAGYILIDDVRSGNGAYNLSISTSGVVKFDSDTYVYALVQTGSGPAVGGGVRITLQAAKID